ncbi:MAG: hypothetical protein ACK5JH_16090 [Anaerocolumna sp.]
MSKQSNQRYRKEAMKNKQDSLKSTSNNMDVQNSTYENYKKNQSQGKIES